MSDLSDRARSVAEVAALHAMAVDRESRFPAEAFEAMRERRLLGIAVPGAFGGEGATLGDVVDICFTLGRACASTAMIYAMHQVKVGCLVRHSEGNPTLGRILRRMARDQLLLASSTTEGRRGGNLRASTAPIERDGEHVRLQREASVISYARAADGIVTTARRSPDAAASDQVLAVFLKADYTLEATQRWDTLGMRGTCSEGFLLNARGDAGQVIDERYETIHARTMVPYAHLAWGGVWAGIATAATGRAQAFAREVTRQSGGELPPGMVHCTQAVASLRTLRTVVAAALKRFEQARDDGASLASIEFQSMITQTKVEASELATATVMSALRACGLAGYRNDGPYSVTRHLRDILSSPVMIHNDRVLANLALPSMLSALPASIHD